MALRPQLVVEVQKGEEFVSCDSCDRILYILPEDVAQPL
jgi:predicted  nucleic acid-binding Zn-ribbon protein